MTMDNIYPFKVVEVIRRNYGAVSIRSFKWKSFTGFRGDQVGVSEASGPIVFGP